MRWLGSIATILIGVGLGALTASPAAALELEPVGSFERPVFVTSDPGDEERLLVVERDSGRIKLVEGGAVSTFLDIGPLVEGGGERGLLSMAFDPAFAANGRFYVYFTGTAAAGGAVGDIHVDELTVAPGAQRVDPATRRRLLTIPHSSQANHNGGQLQIGPDGYLYAGIGDGGGAGDPDGNGQDVETLLGALLRIDPDPAGTAPYSIPPGNPFAGPGPGRDEIWSWGLRNPWRFSFDRSDGALVIADVGQASWEEVNYRTPAEGAGRGDNFGWNACEGAHVYPPRVPDQPCADPDLVNPAFEYSRSGGNCSITGGYVVRDPGLGELNGRYLYADFCLGEIRSVRLSPGGASGDRSEGLSVANPSSFGEDACGRLYVASLAGEVFRLVGEEPTDCPAPPPPGPDPDPVTPTGCTAPATLGTAEPDQLFGGPGDDLIRGRAGADLIRGRGGDDCLHGGRGADLIRGGAGNDRIVGGRGDDRLRGGSGRDVIRSGPGASRSAAGRGADRVLLGSGRNRVRATKGRNRINCHRRGRARVVINRQSTTNRACRRGDNRVIVR